MSGAQEPRSPLPSLPKECKGRALGHECCDDVERLCERQVRLVAFVEDRCMNKDRGFCEGVYKRTGLRCEWCVMRAMLGEVGAAAPPEEVGE